MGRKTARVTVWKVDRGQEKGPQQLGVTAGMGKTDQINVKKAKLPGLGDRTDMNESKRGEGKAGGQDNLINDCASHKAEEEELGQ